MFDELRSDCMLGLVPAAASSTQVQVWHKQEAKYL
jgi:hypothetical protein